MALPIITTLAESNGTQPWLGASPQCLGCSVLVEIDGWQLTLFNDCDTLDYRECCRSPDGRVGTFELWQRDGADPVELLSAWEREQLERLLAGLLACNQNGR